MKIYSTYGVPLNILLCEMASRDFVSDWLDLCLGAFNIGFKWKRLRAELYEAIFESYGEEFRNKIIELLDSINEIGFNKVFKYYKKI